MRYKLNLENCDYFTEFDIGNNLKIYEFLEECGVEKFTPITIPADASKRQYYKIITQKKTYILMDSTEDVVSAARFSKICNFLRENNLSAPEIYFEDLDQGFMLLEDLGDSICTKYVEKNPKQELQIYEEAVDLLVELHAIKPPSFIEEYSVESLKSELDIFKEWYLKYNLPNEGKEKSIAQFDKLTESVISRAASNNSVIVLKDFMADNIIVLNNEEGIKKIGLLDFQDAVVGSKYFDLCSLLQDARRDVSPELEKHCLEHFIKKAKISDVENFYLGYNVCALQKNLRIIGVFHRLNLHYGKTKYIQYLPRMWKYIERNLEAENLLSLKQWFNNNGLPQTV